MNFPVAACKVPRSSTGTGFCGDSCGETSTPYMACGVLQRDLNSAHGLRSFAEIPNFLLDGKRRSWDHTGRHLSHALDLGGPGLPRNYPLSTLGAEVGGLCLCYEERSPAQISTPDSRRYPAIPQSSGSAIYISLQFQLILPNLLVVLLHTSPLSSGNFALSRSNTRKLDKMDKTRSMVR